MNTSGSIYHTEVIGHTQRDGFNVLLMDQVNKCQNQGLIAEVQYAGRQGGGYSALILWRIP